VAGADDVRAAALGQFDHRVPGHQGQAAAFLDRAQDHAGPGPVRIQFLPVEQQAFAGFQNQADDVVLHAPGARSAVERARLG
jgi:hypothetical protein